MAKPPLLPPRGERKPGERRSLTPQRPAFSIWYVLGLLLLLAVAQAWFLGTGGRSIPYSEFKSLVRANQVTEVTVGDQTIGGKLKEPRGEGRQRSDAFITTRIEDPKLVEDLEAHQVKYTGEVVSRWLPEILGWVIPLLLLVALWSFFFRRMGGAEGGVMSFARSRAKIYADDDVKVSFADVAGVDEAEDELREIVEFLKNPKKYTTLGGHIPKGVLLVGPPGTGKTLLARAVAGEAKVPFFSLSGSEFVEMFVGVGAARVRDLFQQAEAKSPCIVFIDELDALGKARVQSPMGSHEEREQTLNQLLAEMDGFDSKKAVIIMGATNRPEVLDSALLRPGRFDRQVLVDKPDINGREAVLKIHVRTVKVSPEVDLRTIASRTVGFAGADLANLVNEAALLAARKDKTAVDMRDFDEAIDRLIAGLEKKRVMNETERRTVAYHESGHAIVASALPGLDPVHKISIVQRGFGALGYTMHLPLEDRYLRTRTDLQYQLAVLLGGRTAEEIALGEISTGAQNDLQRASDLARAMVTEWGMSDAVGAISYAGESRGRFLEVGLAPERGHYAEHTAQLIDSEVKRILTEAHDLARTTLLERRDYLETVTTRLLEREVMEGDELREILRAVPPRPGAAGVRRHTAGVNWSRVHRFTGSRVHGCLRARLGEVHRFTQFTGSLQPRISDLSDRVPFLNAVRAATSPLTTHNHNIRRELAPRPRAGTAFAPVAGSPSPRSDVMRSRNALAGLAMLVVALGPTSQTLWADNGPYTVQDVGPAHGVALGVNGSAVVVGTGRACATSGVSDPVWQRPAAADRTRGRERRRGVWRASRWLGRRVTRRRASSPSR